MDAMLDKWSSSLRSHVAPLKIYVGDSLTDIECLLAVDVGIIISENGAGSLIGTLGRLRFIVRHISCYRTSEKASLWWARNFEEILLCGLLGQQES